MARYYIKGLPWSSGIGTDVKDCTTAKEVMEKAQLDWNVKKCELVAEMPFNVNGNNDLTTEDVLNGAFSKDGWIYRHCPNAYATYRTDINVPLGLVKSKYEVVQNTDAFNFFDEAIGIDKALWQYAGMFGYGHKIFITAKLPITTTVGLDDPIEHYLVFSNSHDGSSSVDIMFTPIRVFCTNTLNAAIKQADSYFRIRHTKSARGNIQKGADILKIACEKAKNATEIYKALAAVNMSDAAVLEYIAKLILSEQEYKAVLSYDKDRGFQRLIDKDYILLERTEISVRKANQIYSMYAYYMYGIAQENILGTAWGAYNAVTGYYSNVANMDGAKRMDNLLWGRVNAVLNEAFNDAVSLIEV